MQNFNLKVREQHRQFPSREVKMIRGTDRSRRLTGKAPSEEIDTEARGKGTKKDVPKQTPF